MRADLFVSEIIAKCEAYKRSTFWLPEPELRPRTWLRNFDEDDQVAAAVLLDHYSFYNDRLTKQLLAASWQSLADGRPKSPQAPSGTSLLKALDTAVCTRVVGERPRPTDSGNLFCRLGRQVLGIPDSRFIEPAEAVSRAALGSTVIFLDDFIGSGEQFKKTWGREHDVHSSLGPSSFAAAFAEEPFISIYVSLVGIQSGIESIWADHPHISISTAHTLQDESNVFNITQHPLLPGENLQKTIQLFLAKYAPQLRPEEPHMAVEEYKLHGYKSRGLMFAFEHSTPDSTLPIFWSPGPNDSWTPLRKRL